MKILDLREELEKLNAKSRNEFVVRKTITGNEIFTLYHSNGGIEVSNPFTLGQYTKEELFDIVYYILRYQYFETGENGED